MESGYKEETSILQYSPFQKASTYHSDIVIDSGKGQQQMIKAVCFKQSTQSKSNSPQTICYNKGEKLFKEM